MHRFIRMAAAGVSGLALTFTVVAASEAPAGAATNTAGDCHTKFASYPTIKTGSHGTRVKAAQCLLARAGYAVKADGSFSAADSAQLKKFQREHHVNASGHVYASSWTALLSRGTTPTLSSGSDGAPVKRLQNSLRASGRQVSTTGHYGASTAKAVKSLQRNQGLSVTGTTTTAVWNTLQAGDAIIKVKKPAKKKAGKSSSKGAKALAFAKRQLGDRYRYGGTGPNAWDCSGLTRGAWKAAKVKLPHSAKQQFHKGKKVSKANLKPGDLVFFYKGISHVGIYAGHGKVIHASRPGKPVAYIKMKYMPYKGARRPG